MDRRGRRVVVTGMGLATPVGLDVRSTWRALREGRGGVGPITHFDAGGAVEAIVCLLAIRDGVVPPTVNLDHPDDDCDLDYVPNTARDQTVDVALSNSFGFGGQNTTLVLRRFAG